MRILMKRFLLISLSSMLLIAMTSVQAGMVGNDRILQQREKARFAEMLQRKDVQRQLIEMGVDPASARARVNQMTDEEAAQLSEQIGTLPAGAGLGTVELLLIIIIIILLI